MVSKTHGPKKGTTGGACGRKGAKFGGMRHTRKKQPGPVEKKAKQQNKIKRGAQVVVAVKQEYAAGKKYDVGDVLKICRLIDSGKMSKADMLAASKKGVWLPKWRVPAKTIYHWMGKEKGEAEPRWHKLAKDGKLPSAGRECVLGRADHVLMCAVIMQHRARVPYKAAAIKLLARRMLIELGAVDPATKKAYTEESDLTGWYRAFMGRCEQNGARIKVRKGHGQGTQRKGSIDVVEYYRDEVSTVFTCPALARALVFFSACLDTTDLFFSVVKKTRSAWSVAQSRVAARVLVCSSSRPRVGVECLPDGTLLQPQVHKPPMERVRAALAEQGKKLTFENKGNYDEFALNLNEYAEGGQGFLVLSNEHVNIEVPFERAPHITVIGGFVGRQCLTWVVVLSRQSVQEHFAANLPENSLVAVMGSQSGWVNCDLKTAAYHVWKNDPNCKIGVEPVLMTFGASFPFVLPRPSSAAFALASSLLKRKLTLFQLHFNSSLFPGRRPLQQHRQPRALRRHDVGRVRRRGDARPLHNVVAGVRRE